MLDTFRKLRSLLSPREQRQAIVVFGMMVIAALVEVVGVASVMPFIAVLADPQVVSTNSLLSATKSWLGISETRDFLIVLGAALLLIFIASLAFRALTLYVIQHFAMMRLHSIAIRLMRTYLAQPYEAMLSRNSSSLAKTVLAEVASVANGVLLPSMRALSGAIVAMAIIALLIFVEPVISVVLAVILCGSYLAIYLATKRSFARGGKSRLEANDARFILASEALQGLKELRVLGREHVYLQRFTAPSREFAHRYAQSLIVRELPYYLVQGIAFGGVLMLLLLLILRGDTLGTILPLVSVYAFAGYRMLPALQDIYRSVGQIKFEIAALSELHADLARGVNNIPAADPNQRRLELASSIQFDGVTFRYESAKGIAVHDLSFEIKAGTSVGLIGRTGAGKSTVADILLGLLPPQGGRLLIDGVPLNFSNTRAWQANIGYVPQSIFIADDTVAANIAFGVPREAIDMQAVERAARLARIHDFIVEDLPARYDTIVGEKGGRLSGGQRQRLGIARALYHDPQVVIFDEATSALDNQTEAMVIETFKNLKGHKTIIMVAHRFSTLESCDQLLMLDKGALVEEGSVEHVFATRNFKALANITETKVG